MFGRHSWAGRLGNLIGGEAWKLDISHGCILLAISHGRMDSHGCMVSRWWQLKHVLFSPGEMIQIDEYCSNGLKPPTRYMVYLSDNYHQNQRFM